MAYVLVMSNATSKRPETLEQMAAIARLHRDGSIVGGKRLPLRYWVALAHVDARKS